jgi:hypothetical protein
MSLPVMAGFIVFDYLPAFFLPVVLDFAVVAEFAIPAGVVARSRLVLVLCLSRLVAGFWPGALSILASLEWGNIIVLILRILIVHYRD